MRPHGQPDPNGGRETGTIDTTIWTKADRERLRALADERLRNEQMFSETMIESMPGILYFYDITGRFIRWNRNLEVVSGYSGEEIGSMHPLDFFSEQCKKVVQDRISEVFAKGQSTLEAPFLCKSGEEVPYFFTGRRINFQGKECLVGIGMDISERRDAELKLEKSERSYRELVESANSIILRWNSEGRVSFLNTFGQRFFGYSSDEIVGQHVTDTIVPATESGGRDLRRLMEEICAAPDAFEQSINENVRKNGERVWVAWTNRIVKDESGQVVEILSIGTDQTDRHRIEVERRKREQAEEADRLKSAFLASMSHELRTPLNSIIGFTGIVLQGLAGPLNEEQTKQLGIVRSSARHLLELINDVLDLSKIEAGQLEVRSEPFELDAVVERVILSISPMAVKKGLKLERSTPTGLPSIVSDRRRVEQILLNLLNNAIKFTDRGQVELKAVVDASGQAIRLTVRDTGIGIKPEDLQVLFQPFRQLDTGLARQHEGTGLGLAICRRLASLLGGEITVQSEWQKGSEFTLHLPLGRGAR